MSIIICNMNCENRSKRPLRAYKNKDGSSCYSCSLDYIVIDPVATINRDTNEEGDSAAICTNYIPIKKE